MQSPPDPADRLLEALAGLDLASADGRAGIRTLLAEVERLSPGAILQQAATIELRRVGWLEGRGASALDGGCNLNGYTAFRAVRTDRLQDLSSGNKNRNCNDC